MVPEATRANLNVRGNKFSGLQLLRAWESDSWETKRSRSKAKSTAVKKPRPTHPTAIFVPLTRGKS